MNPFRFMTARHWIIAAVLVLLVAAAAVGFVLTQEEHASASVQSKNRKNASPDTSQPLIDQTPLQTARALAAMAASNEEKNLVHEAEKLADHELDLAFLDAELRASQSVPPLTAETKEILSRKSTAENAVKNDQTNIVSLTRRLKDAPEPQKDNLQDQLDVANAQLELDQYEVDDAAEDLARAGADPSAKVKRLKAEHDASDKETERSVTAAATQAEQNYQSHTFLAVLRAWRELRKETLEVAGARDEAGAEILKLGQQHQALEKQSEQQKDARDSAKQQAQGFSQSDQKGTREDSKVAAQAALQALKQHSQNQKSLTDLDKRIQDELEISDVYGNWFGILEARQRSALHNLIEVLLWILVIVLLVYLANRITDRFTLNLSTENKRVETLRAILTLSAQAVGAIAILFLIFGVPNQTTTILGLAGAGLTVAMKDFIMAFLGWFSLMGRNGIHVGDWVEINGVAGEVVEIGLMKTVLLETGNWTDAGHPTGRKVSFMNSFAIEGHFFNFTTSGQWMWDELRLTVPANQDPYKVIDGIQKVVTQETEKNASHAEEEWKHTTNRYRVQSFSAAPAINVVPTGDAVEVRVRYITRAYERHEMRRRLYEAVVKLMHGKTEEVAEPQSR